MCSVEPAVGHIWIWDALLMLINYMGGVLASSEYTRELLVILLMHALVFVFPSFTATF